jgi:hypothetical protein
MKHSPKTIDKRFNKIKRPCPGMIHLPEKAAPKGSGGVNDKKY